LPLDVFIAGDDADAKASIAQLVRDGGLRPIDVGALANARHLEGFQLLHMAAQEQLGTGWMSAITIVK
jgi:predicted dinucleotide-binding enzyme